MYPVILNLLRGLGILSLLATALSSQTELDPSEFSARTALYFPRSQATFSSDVKLVEVAVVVKDNKGQTVADLTKSDFEIRDAGKKRDVSSFAIQTRTPAAAAIPNQTGAPTTTTPLPQARPRFVAIVIDDLNSAFPEFRRSQVAASKFVREGLSAGDRVGIFSTYGQQLLPFTSNSKQIADAIDKMRTRGRTFGTTGCPSISPYESYLIDNNLDAQVLEAKAAELRRCMSLPPARGGRGGPPPPDTATMMVQSSARMLWGEVRANARNTLDALSGIVDEMAPLDGSKMILLASGGFIADQFDMSPMERVIQRALRSGVIINSLDAKGLYTIQIEMPPGGDMQSMIQQQRTVPTAMQASNDGMAILAQSTGGRFIQNSNDLDGGFRILGQLPETTYLLGFSPDDAPDGRYHKLEVRLANGKRGSIQARPGYMAEKEKPAAPQQNRKVDEELLAFSSTTEFPVRLSTSIDRKPNRPPTLKAVLHFDPAKTGMLPKNGLHTQKLDIIVALINDRNEFVFGKECNLNFALKPETLARLSRTGMAIEIELDPTPGEYRLRAVLQEANQSRFAGINQMVDIK